MLSKEILKRGALDESVSDSVQVGTIHVQCESKKIPPRGPDIFFFTNGSEFVNDFYIPIKRSYLR